MPKDQEEENKELDDDELKELRDGLEFKIVRDILWRHLIVPSQVLKKCDLKDPIANVRFVARENLGKDLIANIKAANLDAWFQMLRDAQFDEEVEEAKVKRAKEAEANDEGSE